MVVNSHKAPHSSPVMVSYEVPIVSIVDKIELLITYIYYNETWLVLLESFSLFINARSQLECYCSQTKPASGLLAHVYICRWLERWVQSLAPVTLYWPPLQHLGNPPALSTPERGCAAGRLRVKLIITVIHNKWLQKWLMEKVVSHPL